MRYFASQRLSPHYGIFLPASGRDSRNALQHNKNSRQQQDEIGSREFNTIIEHHKVAMLRQPAIIPLFFELRFGVIEPFDRRDGSFIGKQGTGPFGDRQPAVPPMHRKYDHQHS